jgi:hypothetical protein
MSSIVYSLHASDRESPTSSPRAAEGSGGYQRRRDRGEIEGGAGFVRPISVLKARVRLCRGGVYAREKANTSALSSYRKHSPSSSLRLTACCAFEGFCAVGVA